MNHLTTKAIVLNRLDFGEADRIVTIITPDQGKRSVMAKGVRRIKSKLAGGIELFSVSDVVLIQGKKDIDTLVSSRLKRHFGNIPKDLDRTMLSYEVLEIVDKLTEARSGSEYFDILEDFFVVLDDGVQQSVVGLWFYMHLLNLEGKDPNISSDANGHPLSSQELFAFDFETMSFKASASGQFAPNHIKLMRLMLSEPAKALPRLNVDKAVVDSCLQLVKAIQRYGT